MSCARSRPPGRASALPSGSVPAPRALARSSRSVGALLAVAMVALLACAPKAPPGAPPALRAAPPAAAGAPAAGEACASLGGLSAAADPAAIEQLARACELSSAAAAEPAPALLLAARAFRGLSERYAALAELGGVGEPEQAPRDLLARQADAARACAAAAHRALGALFPAVAAALDAGRPPVEALCAAAAPAAEPLYLEAACSATWARAQGFTHLVDRRAELKAALERAAALDPALDDAGPDRELGRLLSSLPAYAGGSLREARAHFDAAVARAPGSVQNRVLYARGVAVKLQDRALFESLLNTALAQPSAEALEKHEADIAHSLLARADDLFGAGP